MINYNHPQHYLPTFVNKDEKTINCLVEIHKGSINKYEIQKDTGLLKLDRVMFSNMPYPFDYGVIPQTYDEDNDLLDVIILNHGEPFHENSLVEGRVIGVIKFMDTGEVDDKIIIVPNHDYRWQEVETIDDLSQAMKEEINFFWNYYKTIQFKVKNKNAETLVKSWGRADEAIKIIEKAMQLYKEKYNDNPILNLK